MSNSNYEIRWLIRRDMDRVLEIEVASFPEPWTEEDFMSQLKQRNCIGTVATDESGDVQAFMIYELHQGRIELISMAVDPTCRYRGFGRSMMERLKSKLSQLRRIKVIAHVRESNLDAQLFFASCGFRCVDIDEARYESETAYLFEHTVLPRPSIAIHETDEVSK